MEAVRSWGVTVCLAALAAGIAGMLVPKGNLEKIYKFAVSLFFLCCVLVPLFNLRHVSLPTLSLSSAGFQAQTLSETVAGQTEGQVRENLAALVRSACKSCGVTPKTVDVSVSRDDSGVYDPQSVSVTLSAADAGKAEAVVSAVKQELGLAAAVHIE